MDSDKLKRNIGLVAATSIGLGAMLGAGIFVFPGLAGGYAGFAAIFSFLSGGVIALLVAACTAELATAMPQSGGGYFFISRSFGMFWGTVVGIAQWTGLIFACAFYLASFGEYAIAFLRELNINGLSNTKALSFSFTFILLTINILGTRKVGRFQNVMVISLTIVLVVIFTYGVIDFLGLENQPAAFSEIVPKGTQSIFTTTALIFTSYLGFVQIANIGAEIKRPSKNLPRSLIWSVLIAMSLYVFVMWVSSVTMSHEELKKLGENATIEVARKMLGKWGAVSVVFAALLAALSSANASIISASRSVFALSKDSLISEKASKINKRFGTPHVALILVSVPVAIILLKSRLEVLAEVASFLHLIIYAGICFSVLKLRTTNPAWYIPTFRLYAAKMVAGVGGLLCLILLFFMQKISILVSAGVLLLTGAYYLLFVRRKQIKLSLPEPPHILVNLLNPNVLIPVDITQEKKGLPHEILKAIPVPKLLLLGYKETPEQSLSEQSEEKFGKEGKKKLESIISELEKSQVNFDTKLIFSENVVSQIRQVIEEEKLQFILKLEPISTLKQIVIPVYDLAQVNTALSTIIYKLYSGMPTKIKAVLFTEGEGDNSNATQLRRAIENQLGSVNISIHDVEVYQKEKGGPQKLLQEKTAKTDLIVWSEADPSQRNLFLKIILEKESTNNPSPAIMILKKNRD